MNIYDIAIIGGGPGGHTAAMRSADLGLKTVLIEKGELGGTCLNRGCVPSKAWVESAHTVDSARFMATISKEPFVYQVDYRKMVDRHREMVTQFRKSLAGLLAKRKVDILTGSARFVSPGQLSVSNADGADVNVKFKNAVIATGSAPADMFGPPSPALLNSATVFDMPALPESLLVVGAGAIGCEIAGVMVRLGVQVTMLEMAPRILPTEDPDISALMQREFKKLKVKIITGTKIETLISGTLISGDKTVTATLAGGATCSAQKALISIGRQYPTGGLGLDIAGVKTGTRGEVLTDDNMKTSAPNIYAVGDVTGKGMLAYTASRQGAFVAGLCAGKPERLPEVPVPSAIFTIPEIGSVGMTQEQAPSSARVGSFMFRALARARAGDELAGFVKIIADGDTDRLLGAHIIGHGATDMIHIACVAIARGMTARELGELSFAHPTFAEAIMEAVHDVHGQSLNK